MFDGDLRVKFTLEFIDKDNESLRLLKIAYSLISNI